MSASKPSSPAIPRAAAALCLVLAIINGIGWLFGIDAGQSLLAGAPKMVPTTGLMTAASAASLWLLARGQRERRLSSVLALLVAATAALIGLCHLAGQAPAPFRLPLPGQEGPLSLSGPITAGMFLVLGLAQFMLARQQLLSLAQSAVVGLLLLSLLNLAGYAASGTSLYLLLPGRGTSILTTVAVIALALGTLLARPHSGIMVALSADLPSAPVARRMLLAAFAVPLALVIGAMPLLHAGRYDPATALPLMAWSAVALFTMLVWHSAIRLHAADIARAQVQRDLRAALDELHAEHERKDVFLATLAHELRNPLAPIRAAADVLGMPSHLPPDRQQALGGIISRQVDHLVRLVDDLMDVSRVNRGLVTLDVRPLDMHVVVEDACEQARPLIARKGQQLRVDMAARPLYVTGDHQRLVQVIVNLLNNAAKYTQAGGEIDVRLQASPLDVSVAVQDNGGGIGPELLPRVFDVFTQAAPGNPEGGLGLGLALVRRLVELHHGTVAAHSDGPGRGSTFTVTLPRAAQH